MRWFCIQACTLALVLLLALPAVAGPLPRGVVRLERRVLSDADGPFLGLGATYMQALRHCPFDRPRLHKELSFLASCGFNYVRVLSMVDWPGLEIPPCDHKNKNGTPIAAWPDYDVQLAELVDIIHSYGLRTQVTLFADAQYIVSEAAARRTHVQRILKILEGREEKIVLYEIANEAWQNGFPGDDGIGMLRALGEGVAKGSASLLALTSPPDAGNRENALLRLYAGSPATVATAHFSRDLRTKAGPWLPITDCWALSQSKKLPPISSNEPIGPGASVASEDAPEMILSAAAFAYLAGLPMYVFHSAAGVRAEQSFETMGWLRDMKSLLALLPRDLPNWERFDSNGNGNPFVPLEPAIDPLYNCGARKGKEFIVLALALDATGRTYRANVNASFSVSALMPVRSLEYRTVATGETFVLKVPARTCVIRGDCS